MSDERRLLCLVLPPWQRPEVWNAAQKQRFVEGVFEGYGCGYYVTNGLEWIDDPEHGARSAPMSGWLLDDEHALKHLYDRLNFGGTHHLQAQRVLVTQSE